MRMPELDSTRKPNTRTRNIVQLLILHRILTFSKTKMQHTPHCNDDLNNINEQRNLMINSSK